MAGRMLRKLAGSLAYTLAKFSAAGSAGNVSSSMLAKGERYWWGGGLKGVFSPEPAAGLTFNQSSALTLSTVYACSRARAETLASLPPMIYRETANESRRRDSSSPLWDLMHDCPNEDMDSMTFYELLQMRIINRGNGFCEIERDSRDRPIALWPIHNSRVTPFRDSDNKLEWHVTTDSFDPRKEVYRAYRVPDRDMLNVVGFGSDGYIGSGVIPMAVEEISAGMAQSQYNASWFAKGARPSAVVEYPTYIDDADERAEFRRQINTLHSGREHWHEVPVMWQGAKWKEIQYSPEQSQLVESRKFSSKTICQFYNVPPAIVQVFDDYKFSTVDAMIQQFVMTCLRSDAVRIERAIRRKITHTMDAAGRLRQVYESPYVFEFVLEALLRGDSEKQAKVLETKRRNGILNADEIRGLDNLEPLPDGQGEIYLVPGGFENLATLGQTYPRGSGSRTGEGQSNVRSSSELQGQPEVAFDFERLCQALERGIPKHRNRSQGGSVADATTDRDEMDAVALDVIQEAINRIEAIQAKELERLKNGTPEGQLINSQRLNDSWSKHAARLSSAILPACKIYCRYRDESPEQLADRIAVRSMTMRELWGEDVTLEIFET
jgi:HK97 family phage portal protein